MRLAVTRELWEAAADACFGRLREPGFSYCRSCVLARALADAGLPGVAVKHDRAELPDGRVAMLSKDLCEVVGAFDRQVNFNDAPDPSVFREYEVQVPEPIL